MAYLKYKEASEKLELDLEHIMEKLAAAKKRENEKQVKTLKKRAKVLKGKIDSYTKSYKKMKRKAEKLHETGKKLKEEQRRAVRKAHSEFEAERDRIKRQAAAVEAKGEKERIARKKKAERNRLRHKILKEKDELKLKALEEKRKKMERNGTKKKDLLAIDNKIRKAERSLHEHRVAYERYKKQRDQLTKGPLWLAKLGHGVRRLSTPRVTNESSSSSGSDSDSESETTSSNSNSSDSDEFDSSSDDDDDSSDSEATVASAKSKNGQKQTANDDGKAVGDPDTALKVGIIAEVEVPIPTGIAWIPCKIRKISDTVTRDGRERREFAVSLENKDFLSGIPQRRLRPLTDEHKQHIDQMDFSENEKEHPPRKEGSHARYPDPDPDPDSDPDSDPDPNKNDLDSHNGSIDSGPTSSDEHGFLDHDSVDEEASTPPPVTLDDFYAGLPDVRKHIRAIGVPAENTTAGHSANMEAIERVHASLDRINSGVGGNPEPMSMSFDDSENRAERLDRLQDEMNLSRRDIQLKATSANTSLRHLSQ